MPSGQIHKRERGFTGDSFRNKAQLFSAFGAPIVKHLRENNKPCFFPEGLTGKMKGFLDVVLLVARRMKLDDRGFHLFLLETLPVFPVTLSVKGFVFKRGAPLR